MIMKDSLSPQIEASPKLFGTRDIFNDLGEFLIVTDMEE